LRVIDRLLEYLKHNNIAPYNFERNCGIANGYLKKQMKGKGSIGSEILEKISTRYIDLSLIWLLTGKGRMLKDNTYDPDKSEPHFKEDPIDYTPAKQIIKLLEEKITLLENTLADKEKIISMLEMQLKSSKT
jgi:hypothetical protein